MKKLSEYKDREAIVLLGKIIAPVTVVLADKKVRTELKKSKLHAISAAIETHANEVFEIMAALEGMDVKDYHCNLLTAPKMLMEVLADKDLQDFFGSALETDLDGDSGSLTGASKGKAKRKA